MPAGGNGQGAAKSKVRPALAEPVVLGVHFAAPPAWGTLRKPAPPHRPRWPTAVADSGTKKGRRKGSPFSECVQLQGRIVVIFLSRFCGEREKDIQSSDHAWRAFGLRL